MATSRPTLSSTGEKQHNAKNAQTGKPKGSKARSRNEMYMEKLDNSVSLSSKRKIESILSDVNNLGDVEKMLLYLRLPTGFSESDVSSFTKSSPSGPNSNREEHTKAYNWICSHLEESPDTSMPKQDVYEEYKAYCDSFTISAVCPADFGKIMKGVFPNMKRRRLGTRGKSRYCYSGIRKKAEMKSPVLPHLELSSTMKPCHICPDHQVLRAAAEVLCSWEKKSHCRDFSDIVHCAEFLIQEGHIPKESDPAKVFISAMEECGKAPKLSRLDQSQESWRQRSPEERRRETTHQLQKKLQQKKLVKSLRIEEEERKKNFGVQVTDINIENSYGNCEVVSQAKESTVDVDGEVSQESGGNLVSPAPGTSNTSNSKESPKKKLTPIQPKTVRNVHLIPIPIQPTDNTPLKLIYMPKTGNQFAVPANINIPGSQPLPGNPQAIISTQARQTIRNKVIVTASQVIQTSSTKPVSTLQTSNGSDQQRKTINLQGAKVNHPVAAQQVLAVNSQWQKPTSAGNQGITFALTDGTNIPMLQTSQAGIQGSIISSDTANQNAGAILANQTLQGMQNNQKHALILSGNNQGGLFSVQPTHMTTDMSASPESILSAGKAVSKEMVVIPTTNQLSSNIPPNAVELVIAQSNLRQCDPQHKYIVSTNTVQASSALNGQNQQTIATSVANLSNLEAMLNQGVGSSQSETISNNLESNVTVSSIQSQDLNQFRPLLSRGNSLPSSLTFPVSGSTTVSHHTEEGSDQCASNLLRSLTEKFKGVQEAAGFTSKNADNMKDTQHNKHAEKDGKSSRLLEELLRDRKPTLNPSKAVKPNPSRRNSQTRPKSVAAGMIESNKGTLHIPVNGVSAAGQGASSIQIAADASLYPSTSINKPKHNKMETVSGMSAAMMLPHEFRTKTEQLDGKGDSQLVHQQQQQQGNNPVRVSFPSQGFTLIAQEGRGGVLNQNIMMAMPNHSHSQILSMIPSAAIAATSSQLSVGSPASNSGQLSSAPSTPLLNLGSPEAVNSRSSNSTPLSEVGSVPVSPAQTQQAQLFFVPIKQGQGLDPALISVNNKSPVKPKNIFTSNQKQGGALVGNVDAGTPLDLTLQDNVIQQQVQNPVSAAQLNLGRKRHHSGGLLMIKNSGSDVSFWQRTIQQQPGILSPCVANIRQLHTKTDMPPPLTLPYNPANFALRGGGGKPTLAGRTINRGKVLSRKRYGSGPSVSVQATQQQTDLLQQADLNIPTVASSTSSNKEEAERLRNLAKRSQSVPLPEMSESLQNFIISTNKGGGPTATYPEEIEKSLKLETVVPRGIHANLNHHFEARRNLSTQLVGMGSDQDQREASNDAIFNEILSEMTGRDENENARSTHLVGSTGSGNCASSQTEIVPNPDVESPWHRFLPEEQTLTQHVTTLEDTSSNSSLELQAFGLDNFPNTSNLDLMANL